MALFLLAFAIVALAVIGMSLGVLAGREPIKGSCGGLSCIEGLDCEVCPHRQGDPR